MQAGTFEDPHGTLGSTAYWPVTWRQLPAEGWCRAALLPGAGTLAFIDIDSLQKRVYGHQKQGARFGHTKIQGKSLLVRRAERAGRNGEHAAAGASDRRHPG